MKKNLLILYTLFVAFLTPFMVNIAYKERSYFAIGGEYALGFTTPIIISLLKENKDDKN